MASTQLKRAVLQRAAASPPPRAGRAAPGRPNTIVLAEIPIGGSLDLPEARLQRTEAPGPTTPAAGCDPANASCTPPPAARERIRRVSNRSIDAPSVDEATAHEIVDAYVAALSGVPGAVVSPWPSINDAVATNEPAAGSDRTLATWPSDRKLGIARTPGPSFHFQGGFVGSLQICYDLCTAELGLIGWVWAGGGVETDFGYLGGKHWRGAYVFAERDFGKSTLGFMPRLSCGTCDPACAPAEHEGTNWGGGIAGFPLILAPGERKELRAAGIEVGALLTPTTACSAALEIIALLDITEYIPPPYGPAIRYAFDLAKRFAQRFNIALECGAGFDVSGTVNLCASVPGGGIAGITADSAKICAGGYAACNVGLTHTKSALPGGGH
jgi:hypothetical protein